MELHYSTKIPGGDGNRPVFRREKSMGFLENLFGKKEKEKTAAKVIYSPLKGNVVPLSEVGDPVFSEGMMGPGVGIVPEEGKLYSPVDGEITVAFHTGHAVGLKTSDNMEVLIHIGIDTVKMNGDGFKVHMKEGDKVKAGDQLGAFDRDIIQAANLDDTVLLLVTNANEYQEVQTLATGEISSGTEIIKVKK